MSSPANSKGQSRALATGSLVQQVAQVTGLLAMFTIITVLARRLSLSELGVYGLLTSLAGYLLMVQNAAGGAAVRGMAVAGEPRARDTAFSSTVVLYACGGAVGGALILVSAVGLSAPLDLSGETEHQALMGALLLAAATLLGWPLTAYRDALRAERRFVPAALTEIVALVAYLALVLGLVLADASFAVIIGASGSLPLLVGLGSVAVAWTLRLPFAMRPTLVTGASVRGLAAVAGYLSLAEGAAGVIYVVNRAILGVFQSAATVGLYEGPVRAHNLMRSLTSAAMVTALPTAAGYHAEGQTVRLAQLLLRGTRYMLALVVPLAVTGMVLAAPILEVWLGPRFREAGLAMAILMGHWLLNGCSGLMIAILVGVGRARAVAGYSIAVGVGNVVLALALIPVLGLEGAALATSVPYLLLFPVLARMALGATALPAGRLAGEAFLPALSVGLVLAVLLGLVRIALDPATMLAVAGAGLGGILAYWLAFYGLCFGADERRLVRDVAAGLLPGVRGRVS